MISRQKAGELSFSQATSFNLDEYVGLAGDHAQSYRYFMHEQLFDHVDIDVSRTFVPNGIAENPNDECKRYEEMIALAGGIDLQLLGIGINGHIGFNEPLSSLSSRTRVKTLTKSTIEANSRFFGEGERQPTDSMTMGIGTILDARQVVLLATGDHKAQAIKGCVEGPVSASCPASALQLHEHAIVVVDEAAAADLTMKDYAIWLRPGIRPWNRCRRSACRINRLETPFSFEGGVLYAQFTSNYLFQVIFFAEVLKFNCLNKR